MNLSGLTLGQCIGLYARNDKERFPCMNGTDDDIRPCTLFYADFKVAEYYGLDSVKETYKNCGDLTKRNYKEVTELAMVLNHFLWQIHDTLKREGGKLPADIVAEINKLYKLYEEWYYNITDNITAGWDSEKQKYYYMVTD